MVCFGNNPRWSFQFGDTAARTLGIRERDTYWIGKFMYVDGQWSWHGSPATGSGGGLTATITKGKCMDTVQQKEFQYTGQVYLPEGNTVNGCCRKLKPGEAPVGPHGYIPSTPPPNNPRPTTSDIAKQPSARASSALGDTANSVSAIRRTGMVVCAKFANQGDQFSNEQPIL